VPVLVIFRTHYAAVTPVETADIIVPGDRYWIAWLTSVDYPPTHALDGPPPVRNPALRSVPLAFATPTAERRADRPRACQA